jgi:large subunit ribosomal protein L43
MGGSSQGLREYIETRGSELVRTNPQFIVEIRKHRGHHPVLRGEYLNGRDKVICVKNANIEDIETQIQLLRNTNGKKIKKVADVQTKLSTIQGLWHPFMHT